MAITKGSALTIRKVANGYIVEPVFRADTRVGTTVDEVLVFNLMGFGSSGGNNAEASLLPFIEQHFADNGS